MKIETKKSVRGFTICRGQGPIDYAPIEVLRCMLYFQFRKEWDINNDFCQFEKKVGANAYNFYTRTISKTGFSARDFVLNLIYNIESDGTVLWCASSHNCAHSKPPHHGTTRGDMPISGLILKPVKGEPNKTYCYIINEVDLKTTLPGFLLRTVYKDQGMQIERIRHVLPKWKKLFPGNRPEPE